MKTAPDRNDVPDVRSIFLDALEKATDSERAAYLDQACAGDAQVRAKVEALLRAHDQAGRFLQPPDCLADPTLETLALTEEPGTVIGRYKLLERIGEGGMAVVYMAEQEQPIRRKVALKIIKLGMDTKQVIARFEAERQALAMMDHPNIAKVLDAGATETGRPYFVMELVQGVSITEYCDENNLSTKDRLALFIQVCHAVQHAHQKGIIHRDIKPSNVMVTQRDGVPVPKVIDFGIAKATNQKLTEKTLFTRYAHLIGTPAYMSPEQAELSDLDIDTRSDIYSLGVLLYELLTGVSPFERKSFEHASLSELQHMIREVEPASPSARLTGLGAEAKAIAACRGTQVIALARLLHRELEWIPLKAMRKDRSRRYRSASEMADDIRNYLDDLPLIAGPETAAYRVRKFVRKHAGSVTTAALVTAALVLGLVGTISMYLEAENARETEAAARIRAEDAEQKALARAEDYRRTLYFNRIALAHAGCRYGDVRRVQEILDACPADLRRWEWYYLQHISDQSSVTLHGHQQGQWPNALAISPDGRRLASGATDGEIKVWDLEDLAELMTLRGHVKNISSVAFSPDGSLMLSSSRDRTARIWDVNAGTELVRFTGHSSYVYSAVFDPTGDRALTTGHDGRMIVWDVATGVEFMTIEAYPGVDAGPVYCAVFSPDGAQIASGGGSGAVRGVVKLWDASSGIELAVLGEHESDVLALAFSPDGRYIASADESGNVKLWDVRKRYQVRTVACHSTWVSALEFDSDARTLVTASWDGTINVWDATPFEKRRTFWGHRGRVTAVAFAPDGKTIFSGGDDNSIKAWDATRPSGPLSLNGHAGQVYSVAYSPDGQYIVSGSTDGTVKLWNADSGTEIMTLAGHEGPVGSVDISPLGDLIVSGSSDTVRLWELRTGREVRAWLGRGDRGFGAVRFSPDGGQIACRDMDGWILVWDVRTGREVAAFEGDEGTVGAVVFSPDGKCLVFLDRNGVLQVVDVASGIGLVELEGYSGPVHSLCYDPKGERIVAAAYEDRVRVWDVATGVEVMSLSAGGLGPLAAAYSPDGARIVASFRFDNQIRLWDAQTGDEVITLRTPGGWLYSVAFSPDGRNLAASYGNSVMVFESKAPMEGPDR